MKRLEASVILLISISMQSSLYAGNFTRSVRNVIRHEEPHAPRKTTHIEEPHIVSTTASRVSHVQSSETPSLKTFHFKPEAEPAVTPKAKIDTAQKNVDTTRLKYVRGEGSTHEDLSTAKADLRQARKEAAPAQAKIDSAQKHLDTVRLKYMRGEATEGEMSQARQQLRDANKEAGGALNPVKAH